MGSSLARFPSSLIFPFDAMYDCLLRAAVGACGLPPTYYFSGINLKAIVHEAEEVGYWAEVPALPGCVTQGETIEEVTCNLREAVAGWLSVETPEGKLTSSDRVIELAV